MIQKYTAKNKFGGYTWKVLLDPIFHIFIHGSENGSYVVEFKEWKWVSYKTHFSFVSNDSLEYTILVTFEKGFDHLSNQKDFQMTSDQWENKLIEALNGVMRTNNHFNKVVQLTIQEKEELIEKYRNDPDLDSDALEELIKEQVISWDLFFDDDRTANNLKLGILTFLIPDNISSVKFYNNLLTLKGELYNADSNHATESIKAAYYSPPGYPTWFTAGYPEVVKWFADMGSENLLNKMNKLNEDDVMDEYNKMKPKWLHEIVEEYRKNVKRTFECQK